MTSNIHKLIKYKTKICVCTTYAVDVEPRAPKHALALASAFSDYEIIFLDCVPLGRSTNTPESFCEYTNIKHITFYYQNSSNGIIKYSYYKVRQLLAKLLFKYANITTSSALSRNALELQKILRKLECDAYFGHNIDILLPICNVAKKNTAKIIFDCMEYYSDMGDGQSKTDKSLIKTIERRCLPKCELILTSSEQVSTEIVREYNLKLENIVTIYNKPKLHSEISYNKKKLFSLYWRNSTIGLGQRGLGVAIVALSYLPEEICLNVQGKISSNRRNEIELIGEKYGVASRINIHEPHLPQEAVISASKYTIGLCPEIDSCLNQRLTVSNKLFDYMMAGLVVVASDLPGLSKIIRESRGGLLFKSGDSEDLASKIMILYDDRNYLEELAKNAKCYAMKYGNSEYELSKFIDAVKKHKL